MDLEQEKLTKSEWDSIEIPIPSNEKRILKLIMDGFSDVNIKDNDTQALISFLKIQEDTHICDYIFMQYLQPELIKLFKKYNAKYNPLSLNNKHLCKADLIRFKHMEKNIIERKGIIFEYILIGYIEEILKYTNRTQSKNNKWIHAYYTLKIITSYNIKKINSYLIDIIAILLDHYEKKIDKYHLIYNAKSIIERNADLIKYKDYKLYDHQKELFVKMMEPQPKMVLYIAPTGTGKTLSPLGLCVKYKIIFVCAVRHVGLALAKAAIAMNKCVAFAFGCGNIDDIKLHYYSAKEYTVNNKTGGIFRVDNSVGDKVEIMISDIKSYLYAMNYMLAFNNVNNIILYWDEPTISLDYKEHKYHEIIKRNWTNNIIPNIVLSSATLPLIEDMKQTQDNYKERFAGNFYSIRSYDCTKSISIINSEGYVETPHYITDDYNIIKKMISYINNNKTILRYVDLIECINFIKYINKNKLYKREIYDINNYFVKIDDININTIKLYYLTLLKNIKENEWGKIYKYFIDKREKRYESTTYISTCDSHTLVGGPTIYITHDIDKIAHFCIQSMNISKNILENITKAINYNSIINDKIAIMERDYDDGINKKDMKEKKVANDRGISPELRVLKKHIDNLRETIKTVNLPDIYIPNTKDHLIKWNRNNNNNAKTPFVSDISDYIVEKIMLISDIDNIWKLLLLMGIGVFSIHKSSQYTEIMKDLAKSKKLYLIIASSDFIYGTNYQFDHCYIGKDLLNMTQEKIIQAFGRVGRTKINDEYTIRIRDNKLIEKIFNNEEDKLEVQNMQKLFS